MCIQCAWFHMLYIETLMCMQCVCLKKWQLLWVSPCYKVDFLKSVPYQRSAGPLKKLCMLGSWGNYAKSLVDGCYWYWVKDQSCRPMEVGKAFLLGEVQRDDTTFLRFTRRWDKCVQKMSVIDFSPDIYILKIAFFYRQHLQRLAYVHVQLHMANMLIFLHAAGSPTDSQSHLLPTALFVLVFVFSFFPGCSSEVSPWSQAVLNSNAYQTLAPGYYGVDCCSE